MSANRGFEMQQVLSFTKFSAVHKSKLSTRYPFLSVNQINGKLKDMWKHLSQEERNKYIKTNVKLTPDKPQRQNKKKRTTKSKKSTSFYDVKNKVETLNVCDIPEYVNSEKLNDFRKTHSVNYENDFSMFGEEGNSAEKNTKDQTDIQKLDGTWESEDDDAAMDMDDDDDDSQDPVLITRGDMYAFEDINDSDGVTPLDVSEDMSAVKLDKTQENRPACQTGETNQTAESDESKITDTSGITETQRNRKRKSTVQATLEDTKEDQENAQPYDCLFKSPNPKKALRKKDRQTNKNQQTPNLQTSGIAEKLEKPQTTPIAPIADKNAENYTTPQMDEVLKILALNEANKAPQKRRQSTDAEVNVKLKAITTGRRATRSLLALQTEQAECENNCMIDEKDEVPVLNLQEQKESILRSADDSEMNMEGTEDKPRNKRGRKNRNMLSDNEQNPAKKKKNTVTGPVSNEIMDAKTAKKSVENTVPMLDPSGDASQCSQTQGNIMNSSDAASVEATGSAADFKHSESGADDGGKVEICRAAGKKGRKQSTDRNTRKSSTENDVQSMMDHRPLDTLMDSTSPSLPSSSQDDQLSLPDSQELQVTPASVPSSFASLSSLRKLTKQHDPLNHRLEKVLEGLQMTGLSGSKAWENTSSDSDVNSPRLLSPALSGISELSSRSISSQSTEQSYSSMDSYTPWPNDGDHKLIHLATEEESGGILCDMFDPATPPHQKSHAMYKTKRYLASASGNEGSKMKDLFERDMLDDICG